MKVLQVLPSLTAGGAEGFVTNLSVSLAGLGAEVRVFILAGARGIRGQKLISRLDEAGIKITGIEERKPASLSNLISLTHLIGSWRPEIVQANLYPSEVACAAARILTPGGNTKYIRRLANTNFVNYRSPTIVKMLDRFFAKTIACSPSVDKSYREFMNDKQRSEVVTIPNGGYILDSVPTKDEKLKARHDLGIQEGKFLITHIGRMFGGDRLDSSLAGGQKAQDVLIKAFAQAFGNDPNGMLALVGDGPLRVEAEALAQNLKVMDQVRFLGLQSEPWPALKAADMFCFPSRHEGLPNVLPEAASCGLPIVASDIPEIRFLYPGDAWLLKPVDDVEAFTNAMLDVYANSKQFISKALDVSQKFREKFSMNTCAEKYLQSYIAALNFNAGGRKNGRV